jgi:hypothetical protein
MSVPEPAPKPKGEIVPDKLIEWLQDNIPRRTYIINTNDMIDLIKERDEFGRKKYGQPLMSQDGRNTIEDARQELGDLMQYIYKAKLNGEDLSSIRNLFPILEFLLFSK